MLWMSVIQVVVQEVLLFYGHVKSEIQRSRAVICEDVKTRTEIKMEIAQIMLYNLEFESEIIWTEPFF